jgi:tetratricopeptide (TPR) repeat protein
MPSALSLLYDGGASESSRATLAYVLDDLYVLRDRARAASARGDLDGALSSLLAAAALTHVAEHDYVAILKPLEELFIKRGETRAALTVFWYLASGDPSIWKRAEPLVTKVPPADRARVFAAQGRMSEAAREMEDAGQVAAAAIFREKAKEWPAARALWSRLTHVTEHGNDAYVAALVRFNLARCARQCGSASQARDAIVASVRLLEEAADHFESIGQRERAFDCFNVLLQIGRESGAFEDVLEGFVNCIRILREDHLKYFALGYFEEAIAAAEERGETSAAATLAREAADYARSLGLASAAGGYVVRQAELWRALAKQHLDRGSPPEIAENALLAAVLAFGEVGQYARVGEHYRELARLDLEASRREHYARVALRYAHVKDEPLETSSALSRPLGHDAHFTDVWHVDVLEWEQAGSAAEACADVLLDQRWPELIRRKAMIARITALPIEAAPTDPSPQAVGARLRLAEQLAQLQLYAVLSPLEKLFEHPDRRVRVAVLQSMQTLFFKRSFVTVRAGLRDVDPAVVEHATRAVETLYFPHAVDPLSRIVRESADAAVRAAAFRAMVQIDSVEAAEFLVGVLDNGTAADRLAALSALKGRCKAKFIEAAREVLPGASQSLASSLREVLAARGIAA